MPATLSGYAFFDVNANGVQDSGEGFAEGVGVSVSPSSGSALSTTTNSSGYFEFTGLASGSYAVETTDWRADERGRGDRGHRHRHRGR